MSGHGSGIEQKDELKALHAQAAMEADEQIVRTGEFIRAVAVKRFALEQTSQQSPASDQVSMSDTTEELEDLELELIDAVATAVDSSVEVLRRQSAIEEQQD